jgi:hypothetical protein
MIARGCTTFIDNFNRAQAYTTTPGMNGWTILDVSSTGTPTYLNITEDGGAAQLSFDSGSEAQTIVLYQNDILIYDVRQIKCVWWIAKVSAFSAVSTLCAGVASAYNATPDSVATNAWFRMQGSASQTALLAETDDAVVDNDDKSTGTTLSSTYKKLLIDFTFGLADVRFFVDGARVASGTTFDMSGLTAGLNVQPYISLQKASGATVDSLTLAQFGIQYEWAY